MKITLPSIILKVFILGYLITLLSSVWEKASIVYGIIIMSLVGAASLIVLIIDRNFNKNYDKKYTNKSIIISIISILGGAIMLYFVSSSFHMFP